LREHGPNRLPAPKRHGPLVRLARQFHNVLIYVLIVAGAVMLVLREWVDAGVIFGVVVINALIGFLQEGKAERALEGITKMLSAEALVVREGARRLVNAEELVPGDIAVIESGDKVPADLRLLTAKNLNIDESALTGESVPVGKSTDPVPNDAVVGDRHCLAHSGTLVTSGQGLGVVISTGNRTEIGQISQMVADVRVLTTPLINQMSTFGRIIALAILVLAGLTFAFGFLVRNLTAAETFLASVAIAVAAIPEGLPAIMTITLALGVQRMARRKAIIRRLAAVDTLGAVTVICSDKTGTLTRNEMTVASVAVPGLDVTVTGVGYESSGWFEKDGEKVDVSRVPLVADALRASVLCNDGRLARKEGGIVPVGDPMDAALVVAASKAGLDQDALNADVPRVDSIPFESERRYMATLHTLDEGTLLCVKGAPERVLEMCALQRSLSGDEPLDHEHWVATAERLAAAGQRVLAVAESRSVRDLSDESLSGLTMLGLFGIIDPPREEAIEAVAKCQRAGIRVQMITGDHRLTALAIGEKIGIGGRHALTGAELERLSGEELERAVAAADVFARVSPEHKLRLIEGIQGRGQVVAMTGDGVNDAPALRRADVGIAMGIKGTDVSKEAAQMVLADDNFASIASAIEEGRTVYDNLRKTLLFILPTNGGQALTIMAAIVIGHTLPITPVQILWVNMITAVTLALALAFEPPEADVMHRPPRDPKAPLLTRFFVWRILLVSVVLWAGTFGLFALARQVGLSTESARTVAVNTLVIFEIFHLLNTRYITASVLNKRGLFGSFYVGIAIALVLAFQLVFTYAPFMHTLFGTAAIRPLDWLVIVLVASSVLFIIEIEKAILRRRAVSD
jgi:magnesium-transporting ATPase (P-type)